MAHSNPNADANANAKAHQHHRSASNNQTASTPNFELSSDPLQNQSSSNPSTSLNHPSLPSTSSTRPAKSKPSPIDTGISHDADADAYHPFVETPTQSNHSQSHSQSNPSTSTNVKRRSHPFTFNGPAVGIRDRERAESKRPTSPHITTATPTSARHPHHSSNTSTTSKTPPPRPSSAVHSSISSTAGSQPQRQSSLGRAAKKFIEAFGSDANSRAIIPQDLDEEDDDEKFKGHPLRTASGSNSGRFTPTNWFGGGSSYQPHHHQSSSSASQSGRRKSEGGSGRNSDHQTKIYHRDPEDIDEENLDASRESILQDLDGNEILNPSTTMGGLRAAGKGSERSKSSNGFSEYDRSPIFDEQEEEEISLEEDAHARRRTNQISFQNDAGRKTPKDYRPLNESSSSNQAWKNHSHRQSHSITSWNSSRSMQRSESEISISMSSFDISSGNENSNSVKIATPKAIRGAINLRTSSSLSKNGRRKRRKSRNQKKKRKEKTPKTFLQDLKSLLSSIKSFLFLFLTPRRTLSNFFQAFISFLRSVDDSFRDPVTKRRTFKPVWFEAYVPLLIWLGISLSSTILVLSFHTQVFGFLDWLANYLREKGVWGRVMLGALIFLTTFPPLPLYSTLIILCGFSFGLLQGFIISYIAALSGAVTVFVLSRTFLRSWMVGLLNNSGGLKKVVRAISKQPSLLILIRTAPYPYNLMNTLLASSPTLTLKTYTWCTAIALPKLLVHTGLGASIQNFAAYHGAADPDGGNSKPINGGNSTVVGGDPAKESESTAKAEKIKQVAGFVGIGLCIGIFLYLMIVARRAVDDLDDEDADLESSIEIERSSDANGTEGFRNEVERRNRRRKNGVYFAVEGDDVDDDNEVREEDDAEEEDDYEDDEDEEELEGEKFQINDQDVDDSEEFDSEEELLASSSSFEKEKINQGRHYNSSKEGSLSIGNHQSQNPTQFPSSPFPAPNPNPLNFSSQTLINPSSSSTLNLSQDPALQSMSHGHRFSSSTTSNSNSNHSFNSRDEISLADKIAQMEHSAENYDTGRHRSGSEAAKMGLNGDDTMLIKKARGWEMNGE